MIPHRSPSYHGEEAPLPEHAYDVLRGFDVRIASIEGGMTDMGRKVDAVLASNKHETVKVIAGVFMAALGVIGAQKGLSPSPTPAPVAVTRSELDVRLDVCRPMPEGPGRLECFDRVFAEARK